MTASPTSLRHRRSDNYCSIRVLVIRGFNPGSRSFNSEPRDITLATRMAMFGRLAEFDEAKDNWRQYAEQMQQFFVANEIEDDARKRAIFLSSVGARTYTLLRSLLHPDKPGEKPFANICATLEVIFHPKPSTTMQRFKFNSRSRQPGESVANYVGWPNIVSLEIC